MKSKKTAGLLCLLIGGFGIHEFYLGDTKKGICYLVAFAICCLTGYGAILYLVFQICVAIHYFTMDQAKFDEKYNGIKPGTYAAYSAPFNSISPVNDVDDQSPKDSQGEETQPKTKSKMDAIVEYKHMLDEGLITKEEFEAKKQSIMNS